MPITRLQDRIEEWRKRLLDLSKRNRLVNCKIGARAAIEIVHPEPELVWQRIVVNDDKMSFAWKHDLLDEEDEDGSPQLSLFIERDEDKQESNDGSVEETADKPVRPATKRSEMEECLASQFLHDEHLLTQVADKALGTRLNRLSLNAKTAIAEQGINILYLAFGLLRWYECSSSDVPLFSPLLLVPVQLDRAGPDSPWKIKLYEEEISPNHCLRELLSSDFGLTLPEVPENGLETPGERAAFLKSVSEVVQEPVARSRWEVMDRVILGTFNFQKLAMWQDLGKNRDQIAAHNLCRAIAGDDTAPVSAEADLPAPEDFDDRVLPKDVHTILDSDSSQLEAVLAVKSGVSLVLDGPPGTGKSQTIANIIAESLAAGKTVLFVSEKAAALEVVKRRLDTSGLGDFCLECHSHKANKKEVIAELGRCLSLPSEEYHDQSEELARLQSVRQRLNSYVRALHRPCGALKITPFAAHGRLVRLKVRRTSHCPINNVLDIDTATLRGITEALGSLTACRAVIEEYDRHPWRGCCVASFSLTLQDDITHDFHRLSQVISGCAESVAVLARYGFTTQQPSKSEVETALGQAKKLLEFPELPAKWFGHNPREIVSRLVELHAVAARCHELWQGLSVFRREIVGADFKTLVAEVCDPSSPWLRRLLAVPPRTVRTQQKWFAALADELAEVRQLVGKPVAILSCYGLTSAESSKSELEAALDQARKLFQFPDLPAQWLARNPRQIVSRLEELHSTAATCQELSQGVSAFRIQNVGADLRALVAELCEQSSPWLTRLRVTPPRTMRAQREWFAALADELAEVRQLVREIAVSVEGFSQALHLRVDEDSCLGLLARLTALGGVLRQTGLLKASWFDDRKRAELQQVAVRCRKQIDEVTRLRNSLSERMNAMAFDSEGESLAHAASAFEPAWTRIWCCITGAWGRFVQESAVLYSHPPSHRPSRLMGDILRDLFHTYALGASSGSSNTLLGDMSLLRAYHSLISAVRKDEKVYATDLICDELGRPRWQDFASGIEAIDRLRALIKIPDGLKQVLTTEGLTDRGALDVATQDLDNRLKHLEARVDSLGQRFALSGIGTGKRSYADVSPAIFQDWLQDMESAVRQRVATLEAVAGTLEADRDVVSSDLPGCLLKLEEVFRLRGKQDNLRCELDGVVDQAVPIDMTVLASLVEMAHNVKRFLDTYGDTPRGSLLDVVTRSEARVALGNACSTLASLLDELNGRVNLLGQRFALTPIKEGVTSYADVSSTVFQEWLREMESGVRRRAVKLEAVAATLEADQDVVLSNLPDCLARVEELRGLQSRQNHLRCELNGVIGQTAPSDPSILAPLVETAHHVARFLDTFGDAPRQSLIEVVTQSESRLSLANACGRLASLHVDVVEQAWATVWKCFPPDQASPSGVSIDRMPLTLLGEWLGQQAKVVDRLQEWIRFREVEEALHKATVLPVLHEVLKGEITIEDARESYLARFYRVWLDAAYSTDATLREFHANQHEDLIATFRKLDHEAIKGAFKRIRTKLLTDSNRPHSGMLAAPPSSEVGTLRKEVGKRRRHLALRQLFRRIPTLLPRLKPCLMMSPLAVSTYLDSPDLKFDLVIFDEASQVRPFDAIGAVYRGSQIVVAGDQKQLPPTGFFDRLVSDDDSDISDDDEDTADWLSDSESVLDVCCSMGMRRKSLRWHYRSRREPLIAFSNHHFYANTLATFPSVCDADGTTAVQFQFVPNGRWRPGSGGGQNPAEARETARLVFQLLEQYPDESLGVITFNQRQQFAVLDELALLRRDRPEMEELFQEDRSEPLFVKNLENVQGDERDRIIISVGYGHDEQGKFAMRFGPLNVQGGERRLNVAVTRAKQQVILVSSIHASDIDLSRVQSVGARILRAYLDYAERGVIALASEITEDGAREADSPFEMAVEEALRSQGLDVRRQVGCGGFRIDLALVHPSQKGQYVLGIECDGATYHSLATARERDRLRQEILEGLGWTICRVWSTDWIRNPESQIKRIMQAFEKALKAGPCETAKERRLPQARQERPILRVRNEDGDDTGPAYSFGSINEVPAAVLNSVILGVLRRYGQTTDAELIKATARELGFSRARKRIAARIERGIVDLTAAGRVRRADGDRLCGS